MLSKTLLYIKCTCIYAVCPQLQKLNSYLGSRYHSQNAQRSQVTLNCFRSTVTVRRITLNVCRGINFFFILHVITLLSMIHVHHTWRRTKAESMRTFGTHRRYMYTYGCTQNILVRVIIDVTSCVRAREQ